MGAGTDTKEAWVSNPEMIAGKASLACTYLVTETRKV
jgi:hypothetical protein